MRSRLDKTIAYLLASVYALVAAGGHAFHEHGHEHRAGEHDHYASAAEHACGCCVHHDGDRDRDAEPPSAGDALETLAVSGGCDGCVACQLIAVVSHAAPPTAIDLVADAAGCSSCPQHSRVSSAGRPDGFDARGPPAGDRA